MLMPTNTVILIGIIFVGLIVPRIKNSRLITMAALDLVAMAGVLMVMLIPRQKKWGRLCGLWLIAFVAPSWPLMLSIFASNTAGFTKKSATSIFIFIAYCIGNIIGPQFFLAKEAPRYEVSDRHTLAFTN
jgi:ACS family allantoate permease-like MFS transporter